MNEDDLRRLRARYPQKVRLSRVALARGLPAGLTPVEREAVVDERELELLLILSETERILGPVLSGDTPANKYERQPGRPTRRVLRDPEVEKIVGKYAANNSEILMLAPAQVASEVDRLIASYPPPATAVTLNSRAETRRDR